ncbi:hypothetical protein TNCV_4810741 [Trichonephila clavipes]|nr:hypothetical protein TNCV_4810741 [Trichonephila clavipes]
MFQETVVPSCQTKLSDYFTSWPYGKILRLFQQTLLEFLSAYRLEERSFNFFLMIRLALVKATSVLPSLLGGPQTHYQLHRRVQGSTARRFA